jgi:hypothetical protein
MTTGRRTDDLPHAPDPGNAGVGRGNKLSVLRIQPFGAQMV